MRHQFITSKKTIVINGLYSRHYWYRVECHKISEEYANLIFGTLPNNIDFIFVSYVASYIHVSMKKVLFIMDLYGFVIIYGFLLNYIKLIIIYPYNF
jgi:lipoprotein signal peptidase